MGSIKLSIKLFALKKMSSYAGDEVGAIVVDVGSHTTKAGFAGEENPKAVVPSVCYYLLSLITTNHHYLQNEQ